jgi:hypothetical protein
MSKKDFARFLRFGNSDCFRQLHCLKMVANGPNRDAVAAAVSFH